VQDWVSQESSAAGVFAAGDATREVMLAVVAAAEGAKAAFAINRALLAEEGRR
jgi:thioredoxin reductase